MKRLLIFLVISIVACAIIEEIEENEEPNEYDDVSLEYNIPRIMKLIKRSASKGPVKKIIKPVQRFVERKGNKVKKVLRPVVKPI